MSASRWGAYNLLTGTSKDNSGGYSVKQLELAGFRGHNQVSHEEASQRAIQIARNRIFEKSVDFIEFALTKKIRRLWNGESHSITWSLAKSPSYKNIKSIGGTALWLVTFTPPSFLPGVVSIGWISK